MFKIDCHTHIISPAIRDEYFSRTDGLALVMQMPKRLMENPLCVRTVLSDERLFLCPCIDLKSPIGLQLRAIEPHLADWKVVGLKLYLTYQKARPTDEALLPIYEFAAEHRLAVTFHTGTCSLVLPSDNFLEGSDAQLIGEICERYPEVNFVAAHMDDPRLHECVAAVAAHDNFFTDFSGLYEPGYAEDSDIDAAIEKYREAIFSQPGMENKILYGTDFCPPIKLCKIDEYEYTIEKLFRPEDRAKIYYENCLRAFPRLKNYIRKGKTIISWTISNDS